MLVEIQAAVKHLTTLIKERDSQAQAVSVAPEALTTFAKTLEAQLHLRCQPRWFQQEPERGSAARAVNWQVHPSGEGPDGAILSACRSVLQLDAEEGEIESEASDDGSLDLALRWLPNPFTLWIDPGCVSIRMGPGPGASRSLFELDSKPAERCSASINVVWGKLLAQMGDADKPLVTITSTPGPPERRPIPIVRPETRYPAAMMNGRPTHSRSVSSSSAASSSDGLSRSASLTSASSRSTDATSYFSGDESDSFPCPDLVSPCSSASSRCLSDADADVMDTLTRFAGANLKYGEDADEGDTTLRAGAGAGADGDGDADECGDATLILQSEAPISSTPRARGSGTHSRTPSIASTSDDAHAPVKCNYTVHDNGNVGVLGGGVRLGGARPAPTSSSSVGPRHRQHQANSKSMGHLHLGSVRHLARDREMRKHEPYFAAAGPYSAPTHTTPLPPLPNQHYVPMHHGVGAGAGAGAYGYSMPQPPPPLPALPLPLPYGLYGHGMGHELGLPYEYSMKQNPHPHLHQHLHQHQHQHVSFALDGEVDVTSTPGRRRVRSRGRRSRGRGAGRAARRQAAALKALEQASCQDMDAAVSALGLDLDLSRCSTPSNSEYTASSATSTPAKTRDQHAWTSSHHHHHHLLML